MQHIVPGWTPVWSEEMAMGRALTLSDTGKSVLHEAEALLRHYEAVFGPVPDWVIGDLTLAQQVALLTVADRLHMRLADHDMVVGEYL